MTREWLYGRQGVREALRAGRRTFFRLRVADGLAPKGIVSEILSLAHGQHLAVESAPRRALDAISEGHQGVALEADLYPFLSLEDLLQTPSRPGGPRLYLLLDLIQDPQNLGPLLRTAEAVAVQGVLLPLHRAVGITPAVVSASAGACEHLRIARGNLVRAIEQLKQQDVWVMGLEARPEAQPLEAIDLARPLAVVVGSEGEGLRPLVRARCDFLARLAMKGRVQSLNAAVAGSIALYLAQRAQSARG